MKKNIKEIINEILSGKIEGFIDKKEEVFLSEDDFKFSLAWCLKKYFEKENIEAKIILEYPIKFIDEKDNKSYIDICCIIDNSYYFFELKYKTKCLDNDKTAKNVKRYGQEFSLCLQGAQNNGKRYIYEDINRLKNIKNNYSNYLDTDKKPECYSITITNDGCYWNPKRKIKGKTTEVSKYSLYENETQKVEELGLNTKYQINWEKWTDFPKDGQEPKRRFGKDSKYYEEWEAENRLFKYLIIDLQSPIE